MPESRTTRGRRAIGGPRTVSALVERDGAILLVQEQSPHDREPTWMLPGGQVEDGETAEAALVRSWPIRLTRDE